MESRHGFSLLLATVAIHLTLLLMVEGAPLPYLDSEVPVSALEEYPWLGLSLAVSIASLLALLLLLLNCTSCCKEQQINFKEFEDNFQDEVDFTPPAEDTPSIHSPAEVYTLAVPPLALPGPPHLEPAGVREGSAAPQVTRQSLSYIQEIGTGWFGKVLLSEMYTERELGASRVVVKELKPSADAKEQNHFLLQADAYRVLQHPNIVHCLGQCVEAIPFLMVFEHCELGDLKSCLKQQDWMLQNVELLQLQKMACEIAAGLTHLHKHNFLHSDLALRNCFLTPDLTVKIGDYGTGPSRYKDDYITTEADSAVPLRWMAPELIGELHGGVVTSEQTKPSNVWALGVTLWELLENGAQPYSDLDDQEVLTQVIKQQCTRLPKAHLELPYSDRWYEALQFCWLPEDKRAAAEEVHRLLTYLRMQGQRQVEEDFQQRWDALRPHPTAPRPAHPSFPILEHFGEPDEVLTVTETSRGLSFEYVWDAGRLDHAQDADTVNRHSMFYPTVHYEGPPPAGEGTPGVLPVFDAHKAASGKEYYIQLEEQGPGERPGEWGSEGESPNAQLGPDSQQQQCIVLHDVVLDESSTEAEFFPPRSGDSGGSNPAESQACPASEPTSPYRADIFGDGTGAVLDDPWGRGLLEMPELSAGSFQKGALSVDSGTRSVLGGHAETGLPLGDTTQILDALNPADDLFFLKNGSLGQEGAGWGPRGSLEALEPDSDLRVISVEYAEMATSDEVEAASDPTHCRVEPPNFPLPLTKNDTLVPSGMTDASGDSPCDRLPVRAISPDKEPSSSTSPKTTETDHVLDPTSYHAEVMDGPANSHQPQPPCESAKLDVLCSSAENLSSPNGLDECKAHLEEQHGLSPVPLVLEGKTTSDCSLTGETTLDHILTDGTCGVRDQTVLDHYLTEETSSSSSLTDGTSLVCGFMDRTTLDCSLMDEAPSLNGCRDGSGSGHCLPNETILDRSLKDQTTSDHSLKDGTGLDETTLALTEGAPSDCGLTDGSASEYGPLDRTAFDCGLNDQKTLAQSLSHGAVSGLSETASGSLTDGSTSDSLPMDEVPSDHGPAEELLLEHILADVNETVSDHNLTSANSEENLVVDTEDVELQGATDHEHLTSLPKDANVDSTPLLLTPDPLLEQNGQDSLLDDSGSILTPTVLDSAETPDSLDSMDIRRLQPPFRTPDSGYDTENLESPDWSSDPVSNGSAPRNTTEREGPEGAEASAVAPLITVSEAESTLDPSQGSTTTAAPLTNHSYRDSAYFSDNESELEKRQEETGRESPAGGVPEQRVTTDTEALSELVIDEVTVGNAQLPEAPGQVQQESKSRGIRSCRSAGGVAYLSLCSPLQTMSLRVHHCHQRVGLGSKPKERDVEGRYLSRREGASGTVPVGEDGSEADEEDENSDDSDEEEAQAYRLHSSSSDSEDDSLYPMPIVVMDTSQALGLRSLLKATASTATPLPPLANELPPPEKKAVSFFDDVTLYLFDQDIPTKDLGDQSCASSSHVSEFSPAPSPGSVNRATNSESSTDEEGGAFEWDDDFSSPESSFIAKASTDLEVPKPPASAASRYFSPPPPSHTPEQSWPRPSGYSRFSISPASISSLSLTHVTDSDIEQGGNSEDGDKE
ncbi:hypothetical protein AGOR_G00221400 [Albula goreensis]|uniref:non-specific serine/threonine protein kinase n=1 Tax=Albula goreensis TaxID=1534307 RepID=A0A8T3CMF6_9TELE|nr:hypothetical protein AGOR_G00221400 [Albula goreensis]